MEREWVSMYNEFMEKPMCSKICVAGGTMLGHRNGSRGPGALRGQNLISKVEYVDMLHNQPRQ